jgi:hypothetical protein
MKKKIIRIIIILILIIFVWAIIRFVIGGSEDTWICVDNEWIKHGVPSAPMPTEPCGNQVESDVVVFSPQPNQVITSPLEIEGEARGFWFFEADFLIVLVNWDGLIIGEGLAMAQTGWMTEDFVEFKAVIEFEKPDYGERGTLIFRKDNPSGLPEHDDAFEVLILFE